MGIWDKLRGKADRGQDPPPPAPPRDAKAIRKPVPAARPKAAPSRPRTKSGPAAPPDISHEEYSRRLVARGNQRRTKRDFKGAIQDYTKAIQYHPESADAYTHRALAREASGDVEGAKADYTKSIELQVRAEINRQLADQ